MRSTLCSCLVSALLLIGCASAPDPALEENKDLVRRFIQAANEADWAALDALVAADLVRHSAATAGPPRSSMAPAVELGFG